MDMRESKPIRPLRSNHLVGCGGEDLAHSAAGEPLKAAAGDRTIVVRAPLACKQGDFSVRAAAPHYGGWARLAACAVAAPRLSLRVQDRPAAGRFNDAALSGLRIRGHACLPFQT